MVIRLKHANKTFLTFSFLITAGIAFFGFCSSPQNGKNISRKIQDYPSRLEKILDNLETLVHETHSEDPLVREMAERVIAKIHQKELAVYLNPNLAGNIYEGAYFGYRKQGSDPHIAFSPYIVDLYETHPSIVYAIIMHESKHADSFFHNRKYYLSVEGNPIEEYMFELDSYHIEAMFIRDYVMTNKKFKPTKFENFLATSFIENNLRRFSYGALGTDAQLTYYLNDLIRSDKRKDEKYAELDRITDSILKQNYRESDEPGQRFNRTVPLHTMVKFYVQFVRDIETYPFTQADYLKTKNFNLKTDKPELYEKFTELVKTFNENRESFNYIAVIKKNFLDID